MTSLAACLKMGKGWVATLFWVCILQKWFEMSKSNTMKKKKNCMQMFHNITFRLNFFPTHMTMKLVLFDSLIQPMGAVNTMRHYLEKLRGSHGEWSP